MRSQIQGIKSQNGPGRNLLGADFWFLIPTSRLERQGRSQKPKTTFLVSKSRLHSARPECRLPDSDFKAPTEGSEENSRKENSDCRFPISGFKASSTDHKRISCFTFLAAAPKKSARADPQFSFPHFLLPKLPRNESNPKEVFTDSRRADYNLFLESTITQMRRKTLEASAERGSARGC